MVTWRAHNTVTILCVCVLSVFAASASIRLVPCALVSGLEKKKNDEAQSCSCLCTNCNLIVFHWTEMRKQFRTVRYVLCATLFCTKYSWTSLFGFGKFDIFASCPRKWCNKFGLPANKRRGKWIRAMHRRPHKWNKFHYVNMQLCSLITFSCTFYCRKRH